MKNIVDTMHNRSRSIIDEKKAAMEKDGGSVGEGKDIMSILRKSALARPLVLQVFFRPLNVRVHGTVRANMAVSEKEKLSDDEIIAQVSYAFPHPPR